MWILESFRQIPGPVFLFYNLLYIFLLFFLSWLYLRYDGTENGNLPRYSAFSATEIAYLRGDIKEAIITALYRLTRLKLIKERPAKPSGWFASWFKNRQDSLLIADREPPRPPLDPLEQVCLKYFEDPREVQKIFEGGTLSARAEEALAKTRTTMLSLSLLRTDDQIAQRCLSTMVFMGLTLLPGLLKAVLGVWNGKSVGFLMVEVVVSGLVLLSYAHPANKVSHLGSAFLNGLEKHFAWMKDALLEESPQTRTGVLPDPAFALAIFGISTLKSGSVFADFAELYPQDPSSGGGCGGGGGGGGGCGGCGG